MNSELRTGKIKRFPDFEQAVDSLIKKDRDYIIIRHVLKKGEKIKLHHHNKANEWVVISNGHLEVEIDGHWFEFDLGGEFMVIFFPKTIEHRLLAKSDIAYFVLRDKKDRTIYSRRPK